MITAYIDGGSRGNPGPAGYGVHIVEDDGSVVEELHESVGTATNNVAEYRGLLAALAWAIVGSRRCTCGRTPSSS
jgi:probable phosphoglycerate mutase